MTRTAWSFVVCVAAAAPAAAQADPPTKGAVRLAYRAWQAKERAAGLLALRLRRSQEAWLDARDALRRYRRGKSRATLAEPQHKAQIDALEQRMLSAKRVYEALSRKEAGKYRARKGEAEAALRAASTAVGARLAAHPDDLEARRARAELLASKGRFRLAERDIAALLKADPDDPQALTLDGRRLEAAGDPEAAVGRYRKGLARAPSDELRLRCAVALFWTNRFAEARALRDAVKTLDPLPPQLQLDFDWYLRKPQLEEREAAWKVEAAARAAEAKRGDLPRVELTTSRGKLVLELFEDDAPNAVASFVSLVESKFYDGLPWHRVQPSRLAATGRPGSRDEKDPQGPGYRLAPERKRRHFRGSVGLLATGRRGLVGSQFYVMFRSDPELDEHCTVFGRVVHGLQVAAALRQDDLLQRAAVLRKRDHPYRPKTIR